MTDRGEFHFSEIERAASLESNVLLLGKTAWARKSLPLKFTNNQKEGEKAFRPINCPGIPPSSLGGHSLRAQKRSFYRGHRRFGRANSNMADGGTIFLDEIADAPIELQSKLLRVIENKNCAKGRRRKDKMCDVRIIAGTSHDLPTEWKGKVSERPLLSFWEHAPF